MTRLAASRLRETEMRQDVLASIRAVIAEQAASTSSRAPRTSATSTRPRRRSRSIRAESRLAFPQPSSPARSTSTGSASRSAASNRRADGNEYTPYEWRVAGCFRTARTARPRAGALRLLHRRPPPGRLEPLGRGRLERAAHAQVHRRHAARLGRLGLPPLVPGSLRLRRAPADSRWSSAPGLPRLAGCASRAAPPSRGLRTRYGTLDVSVVAGGRRRARTGSAGRREAARRASSLTWPLPKAGPPMSSSTAGPSRAFCPAGETVPSAPAEILCGGRAREPPRAACPRTATATSPKTAGNSSSPTRAAPALDERHRQRARGPRRQPHRQRLLVDRQLAARGGHALAAGARGRTARASSSTRATPTTARSGRSRPSPVWAPLDRYACRHGFGYTVFETAFHGLEARWTLFCDAEATVELWKVELANASGRPRRLDLVGFLEWCWASPPRRGASSRGSFSRPGMTRRSGPSSPATTCGTSRRRASATGTRASRTSAPSRPREPLDRRAGRQGRVPRTFRRLRRARGARDRTTGRPSSAATRIRSRPCAARSSWRPHGTRTLGFVLATGRFRRGGRGSHRGASRSVERWTRRWRRSARAGATASRRTAWRPRTPRSTRSPTTGSAIRRSRRDSGRAAATTSRAAPSVSATSSRTRRSG